MSRTISIFIAILCGINLYGDKYIAAFEPGAIYGYRQTIVLEALEAEVGKKASEIFDFMGGTSTGAVIAALASSQNDESKSGYSAAEIRHMYEVVGRSLFSESKPFTMGEFFASRGFEKIKDIAPGTAPLELQTCFYESEAMPNAPLATYGDGDFLSALAHHLGAEAKLSDAILPVALFTNHLPAKQYFTISNIFSYLGYGEGGGDLVGLTSIAHPKVRIVDAVRASAAMRDLFVPHEFELNGESHIFIDAASAKLSTLEETIKIAKKIWPDEKLYVFKFGDHPMEGHIESVHESLKAKGFGDVEIFDLDGKRLPTVAEASSAEIQNFSHADVSDEHFASMAKEAKAFIASSPDFLGAIKQIRSKFAAQAVVQH